MPIVEMQYKLKGHLRTFKEPGEIQKIIEEELGGGILPMDYQEGVSGLGTIGKTLHDTLRE